MAIRSREVHPPVLGGGRRQFAREKGNVKRRGAEGDRLKLKRTHKHRPLSRTSLMPNTPSVFLPYKFLSKGRIVIQKSLRVGPHGNTDLGETHALLPTRPVTRLRNQHHRWIPSFSCREMNFYDGIKIRFQLPLAILSLEILNNRYFYRGKFLSFNRTIKCSMIGT